MAIRSNSQRNVVGVDVGGANIKLADARGFSFSRFFPMWLEHANLESVVREMLAHYQQSVGIPAEELGVTLTGEMADCFETRRQGVSSIMRQIGNVFPPSSTHVYSVHGTWLDPQSAVADPWRVAASNWRALADWICRSEFLNPHHIDLIVDIGSTTTDIIPLAHGRVATQATTDRQRMQRGQLVYSGMERTPITAVLSSVQLDSGACPLMAEQFATTDDVFLVLGLTPESPQDSNTADGRPRTRAAAQGRLARMIGEDLETAEADVIEHIARQILRAQAKTISTAIERNLGELNCENSATVLLSGHGRMLFDAVQRSSQTPLVPIPLSEYLDASASRNAPAVAVACLLEHELSPMS